MAHVKTPEDEAFVQLVNSDLAYFKQVMGLQTDRSSAMNSPCPLCGAKDSMQWGLDDKRVGMYYFHCHRCGVNGDTITAVNLVGRLPMKDTFKKLRQDFAGRLPKANAHDQYHQQRQQEIRHAATQPAYSSGAHASGVAHNNMRPVFPPRPLPAEPRTKFGHQPINRGHVLPAPSFVQNEHELVHQPTNRPDPVLNLNLANQFVETHHKYLLDHFELMKKWRRGISREVVEKYKIGFAENVPVKFRPWQKAQTILAAWVLPITDEKGALRGVKIHCEMRMRYYNGEEGPKCFWMPFGTQPMWQKADKEKSVAEAVPVHSYYTLWPHPDTLTQKIQNDFSLDASWWLERMPEKLKPKFQDKVMEHKILLAYALEKPDHLLESPEIWECNLKAFDSMKREIMDAVMKTEEIFKNQPQEPVAVDKPRTDWSKFVFLNPGELKALSCESCGYMATGSTGGESWLAGPELLAKFAGQAVCLMADDDPPKRLIKKKDGEPVLGADGSPEVLKIMNPGRDWVARWAPALGMYGAEKVATIYGGQKVEA